MTHKASGIRPVNPGFPGTSTGPGSAPVTRSDLRLLRDEILALVSRSQDPLLTRRILNADIVSLSADKITALEIDVGNLAAGTITVAINVGGDEQIVLDGENNQIVISDGVRDRVILGDLGVDYGIEVYNSAGTKMWSATDGAQTAGIADLAVTNAKIATASIDKLTAGTLDVVMDIAVGGKVRTASSGARTEMDDIGIVIYDSSDEEALTLDDSGIVMETGTSEGSTDSIQWFRRGTADSDAFALLTGAQTATAVRGRHRLNPRTAGQAGDAVLEYRVTDQEGNERSAITVKGATAAGTTEEIDIFTKTAGGTRRGRVYVTRDSVTIDTQSSGNRGFLKAFASVQGSGNVVEANGLMYMGGSGGLGAGFVYPNGFSVDLSDVRPGNVQQKAISWPISFPASANDPVLFATINYDAGVPSGFTRRGIPYAINNSDSGATVGVINEYTKTRALRFCCFPMSISNSDDDDLD